MLKPLTLSVCLAVALGACSVGKAGHHDKVLPSAQGPYPTEQIVASPQCDTGCGEACAPKKHCGLNFGKLFHHKPKCYTYTWVLKKKRVRGHHGGGCGETTE